jgi:branched-chain amino acid transport system permease protein
MVILGGIGSIWGVLVGGSFLAWLNVEGLAVVGTKFNDVTGADIEVPKYQFGIYGIIIVLVMLFRPTGLIPERRRKREFDALAEDAETLGEDVL